MNQTVTFDIIVIQPVRGIIIVKDHHKIVLSKRKHLKISSKIRKHFTTKLRSLYQKDS